MRHSIKATGAVTLAVALLLGGAATLAAWEDSATAQDTEGFTFGHIEVDGTDFSAWKHAREEGYDTTEDWVDLPVTYAVPGDVIYTTATFQVTGEGDHLAVKAEATDITLEVLDDFEDYITLEATDVVIDGATGGVFSLADGETADVTVTVTATISPDLPNVAGDAPGTATMRAVVNVGSVTVTFSDVHYLPAAP